MDRKAENKRAYLRRSRGLRCYPVPVDVVALEEALIDRGDITPALREAADRGDLAARAGIRDAAIRYLTAEVDALLFQRTLKQSARPVAGSVPHSNLPRKVAVDGSEFDANAGRGGPAKDQRQHADHSESAKTS